MDNCLQNLILFPQRLLRLTSGINIPMVFANHFNSPGFTENRKRVDFHMSGIRMITFR